jgi:imidazolonepropionase-like amidohydrolase
MPKLNRLHIKTTLLVSVLSLFISNVALANIQVIHAGKLLTIPGKAPLTKQTLIIENGKIVDIKSGFISAKKFAADAELLDLSNEFVMPGLMDMHVHLQGQLGPKNDTETLRMSDADIVMRSVQYAQKTLLAGFTTVRDLGSKPEQMHALRDAFAKQWIVGPRIISATTVGPTGGHMDTSGMNPDLLAFYQPDTICDGPYECRKATRKAIKYGADLIKIASTGGVLTDNTTGTGQQMDDDEIAEIVKTAHALGRKVASHAHAAEGINAALRGGVDSIEHGSYSNDESIKLFKQTGAYLIPTLLAGDTVVDMAKHSDFMTAAIKAKAIRVGSDMMKHFSKAVKAGVNIAFGTDSGVSHHGENAKEAVLMHKAGMDNNAILKSATVNAADLIGYSKQLGTLEKGKIADIIAMKQSPIEHIEALLSVNFVMKSGEVVTK